MHAQLATSLQADLRRHLLLGQWGDLNDTFEGKHMTNIADHFLLASGDLEDKELGCACSTFALLLLPLPCWCWTTPIHYDVSHSSICVFG